MRQTTVIMSAGAPARIRSMIAVTSPSASISVVNAAPAWTWELSGARLPVSLWGDTEMATNSSPMRVPATEAQPPK